MTELPGSLTFGDLKDAKLVLDVLLADIGGGSDVSHCLQGATEWVSYLIEQAQSA